MSDHPSDWDNWVSLALFAYNTACHDSTGFSPYEMIFGRMAHTPLELDLDTPLLNPCSQSEYTQSIRKNLQDIKSQKSLSVNILGLHFYLVTWSGYTAPKTWKFGKRLIGPNEVLSRNWVNYKVRYKDGEIMEVHHDNLKQCVVAANKGVL